MVTETRPRPTQAELNALARKYLTPEVRIEIDAAAKKAQRASQRRPLNTQDQIYGLDPFGGSALIEDIANSSLVRGIDRLIDGVAKLTRPFIGRIRSGYRS